MKTFKDSNGNTLQLNYDGSGLKNGFKISWKYDNNDLVILDNFKEIQRFKNERKEKLITEHFNDIEIYYINVDSNIKRNKSCLFQLSKIYNKSPIRVSGIVRHDCPDGYNFPRWYGTSITHYNIFKTIKKSNKQFSMICEDDMIVFENYFKDSDSVYKELKTYNWDIFYLHDYDKDVINSYKYIKKIKGTVGANCYIINNENNIIDYLIEICDPFKENKDLRCGVYNSRYVIDQILKHNLMNYNIYAPINTLIRAID